MPQTVRNDLAAPPHIKHRKLRILGTEITLLELIRARAEADLGIDIEFEVLDFLSCQRRAALESASRTQASNWRCISVVIQRMSSA